MPRPWSLALVVAALGCSFAATATASITFPPAIQSQLGLDSAPTCTLCHRTDIGGLGTVVTPFGRTMMSRYGLGPINVSLLRSALTAADADHVDSDSDGVADLDELRMNTDPNVGLPGQAPAFDVPLPETGCMLTRQPAHGGVALTFAGLVLLGRLRRRVARARSAPESKR